MKLNKKNIGEYIGYMSIAVVCVLSLVLSFGIVDLYDQPIVANAQVINGIDYPQPNVSDFIFITSSEFDWMDNVGNIHEFYVDLIPYLQNNSILYLSVTHELDSPPLTGYAHAVNNGMVSISGNSFPIVCTFALTANTLDFDQWAYEAYIYYDSDNESYWIYFQDNPGTFSQSAVFFNLYSVPTTTSDNSTTESFLTLIGDGITFGFDSIASGITYTMDNLFVVDGELTNFSVILFLMTGISLALSVLKFVLNFIFSFGGKD